MAGERGPFGSTRSDLGVSPVVGMVLILVVSVVATGTTLMWGLPAIDSMKANVELESVKGQFHELNGILQDLVSGTAGATTIPWQPSLQRGEVYVDNSSHRWVVAVDKRNSDPGVDYNFEWGCTDGSGNAICVENRGTDLTSVEARVYHLSGATRSQGTASTDGSTTQMSGESWANGVVKTFHFHSQDGNPWDMDHRTLRVDLVDTSSGSDGPVIAEAWIVETGQIRFRLPLGDSEKEIVSTNRALLTGANGAFSAQSAPGIPPARVADGSPGSTLFFVRFVEVQGTSAFAGNYRFDALLSLHGTSRLQDHRCTTLQASGDDDCISRVRVYPFGELAELWLDRFTSARHGYEHTTQAQNAHDGLDHVLYEPPATKRNGFWGVHSVILFRG